MKKYVKLLNPNGGGGNLSLKQLSGYAAKKSGFTLAEVLITLGIVGVVAAITLPSLITNIKNKGYVEGLKKNISVLQQVTNTIIQEEGTPDTWVYTVHHSPDNSANDYIVRNFVKHLQTRCYRISETGWSIDSRFCDGTNYARTISYKNLDGTKGKDIYGWDLFAYSYPIMLNDGTMIGIRFAYHSGGTFRGTPAVSFIVDVNGWKGPNTVGRDIFFLYLTGDKSGKILPYVSDEDAKRYIKGDTCERDKSGHSCAYRIITEGKMNY